MSKYFYGRKSKTFDARDDNYHFNKYFKKVEIIPDVIDLEANMPSVYDQSTLGGCTAFGTCETMEYFQIYSPTPVPPTPPTPPVPPTPPHPTGCLTSFINSLPGLRAKNKTLTKFVNAQPPLWQSIITGAKISETSGTYTKLSELFEYYQSRSLEGTVNEDSGCEVRDALKSGQMGVCSDALWPYLIQKYTTKPNAQVYAGATYKIASYHTLSDPNNNTVNNLTNIYAALSQNLPVILGFTVYSSFENIGSDGIMPMPVENEEVLGGHCVVCVACQPGYLKIRNSWSADWGLNGDFLMPISFISHLDSDGSLSVSDMWTIQI